MKNLLKKLHGKDSKKGFTLAELLVVVAIVGILVAISVPLFTAQLGKARKATNQANMRAAKIAAVAQYVVNKNDGKEVYYSYNITQGTVTSVNPYEKPSESTYEVKDIENAASNRLYTDIKVGVCVENPDVPTRTTTVEIFVNK